LLHTYDGSSNVAIGYNDFADGHIGTTKISGVVTDYGSIGTSKIMFPDGNAMGAYLGMPCVAERRTIGRCVDSSYDEDVVCKCE
jgi:hypothetical protein